MSAISAVQVQPILTKQANCFLSNICCTYSPALVGVIVGVGLILAGLYHFMPKVVGFSTGASSISLGLLITTLIDYYRNNHPSLKVDPELYKDEHYHYSIRVKDKPLDEVLSDPKAMNAFMSVDVTRRSELIRTLVQNNHELLTKETCCFFSVKIDTKTIHVALIVLFFESRAHDGHLEPRYSYIIDSNLERLKENLLRSGYNRYFEKGMQTFPANESE